MVGYTKISNCKSCVGRKSHVPIIDIGSQGQNGSNFIEFFLCGYTVGPMDRFVAQLIQSRGAHVGTNKWHKAKRWADGVILYPRPTKCVSKTQSLHQKVVQQYIPSSQNFNHGHDNYHLVNSC